MYHQPRSAARTPFLATRPVYLLVTLLAGCAFRGVEAQAAAPEERSARRALVAFGEACRRDSARLWGRSLCGAVILVDPASRAAIANTADAGHVLVMRDGVWTGTVPPDLALANTALEWSGTRWAMILRPLPGDPFAALSLVAHESFHRLQPALGLEARDALNAHLDTRDGRLWLRLELHALAYALTTTGETSRQHARAAMRFGLARRAAFAGADSVEDLLELQEGVAEYTGQALAAMQSTLGPLRTVEAMQQVEQRPTLVRSFAYATGPALGFLLDRYRPGWRVGLRRARSPSRLLTAALGVRAAGAPDSALLALAEPYGYAAVTGEEDDRAAKRAAVTSAYRAQLVDGPVLRLVQRGLMRSFNPNELFPLDTLGVVYPTGEFSAAWGKLVVSEGGGALVASDFSLVRVASPLSTEGRTIRGTGWVLELSDGWRVIRGARAGDFEVGRSP